MKIITQNRPLFLGANQEAVSADQFAFVARLLEAANAYHSLFNRLVLWALTRPCTQALSLYVLLDTVYQDSVFFRHIVQSINANTHTRTHISALSPQGVHACAAA